MHHRHKEKHRRSIQIFFVALAVLAFVILVRQNIRMFNGMIEERDRQMYALAFSIDNNLKHELQTLQDQLQAAISGNHMAELEEAYALNGNSEPLQQTLAQAAFDDRENVSSILLQLDGQTTLLYGETNIEGMTFLPDEDRDNYEVCCDGDGEYHLAIRVPGSREGLSYELVLDLNHFYAGIVPAQIRDDYWVVIGDKESGLLIQNHDNQLAYVVLSEEELQARGDGYTIIMDNEKKQQRGATTYEFANYGGKTVQERIITLPSSQTVNGSFVIGISQDSEELYAMLRRNQLLQTFSLLALVVCGVYCLITINRAFYDRYMSRQRLEHLQREKELTEELTRAQIRNSVSQMQPHFMFNALSSIRELIYEEPNTAADLLHDFTLYLRACIHSLQSAEPIPFTDEVRNIRAYTNIERMRIGDRLQIIFDLEDNAFSIVPLGIQPFVENAIRHGIAARRGKTGTVTIQSRRTDSAHVITITDDGVGFDYPKVKEEIAEGKRDSTGLSNAILRLEKLCGASVEIESRPGEGTTVTVSLPLAQTLTSEEEKKMLTRTGEKKE